jgi:hypothetical protein
MHAEGPIALLANDEPADDLLADGDGDGLLADGLGEAESFAAGEQATTATRTTPVPIPSHMRRRRRGGASGPPS